jgi:uncharacterized metal-binding protein YceD (DUF177 family)
MKVRISDIPPAGLKVNDTLPLEALNARMTEGRGKDILFTEAPTVNLLITRTQSGAETKGGVKTKYRQQCSRCLIDQEHPLEIKADFTLHHKPTAEEISEDIEASFTDDVGIAYFEGDHIDLENLLQEALILTLSLYWAPPCDAKGNCTKCGLNRAKFESHDEPPGNSLGNLLKKAGLN